MLLAGFQKEVYDRLEKILARYTWAILRGQSGCGRRTVATLVAEALGLRLCKLSLSGHLSDIQNALLGHSDAESLKPNEAGLLAHEDACLILTEIEAARPEVIEFLFRLSRSHLKSGGERDPHTALIILIFGEVPSPGQIGRIQSLMRYIPVIDFPNKIPQQGIIEVIQYIALSIDADIKIEGDDFSFLQFPQDGFHLIKKWIVEAITEYGCCTQETMRRVLARSMSYYLDRLVYRGKAITIEEYMRWVAQLSPGSQPIADRILRAMVEEGYVFENVVFYETLKKAIVQSGIPIGTAGVVFCDWQGVFKSSNYVTYEVKKLGAWGKYAQSIDLSGEPAQWRAVLGRKRKWVILADDFVGTGNTVSAVAPKIGQLLDAFRNVRLRALFVAGFADGIQVLKSLEKNYGAERCGVHVGRLFYGSDTCFHPDSRVLENQEEKELIAAESDRLKHLGLGTHCRGYGALGALIVMPFSVPNTTLPLLWFDRSDKWIPLFPASMIPAAIK